MPTGAQEVYKNPPQRFATVMKLLAKSKMELAIENVAYANDSYEAEMSQDALLNEAIKKL